MHLPLQPDTNPTASETEERGSENHDHHNRPRRTYAAQPYAWHQPNR